MHFTFLTFLLIGLGLPYVWGVTMLLIGLYRVKWGHNSDIHFVSIVVAARDEEKHIGNCLAALSAQQYPKQKYEIVVVDDRSTDRTSEIVDKWVQQTDKVRLLHVGPEPSPLVGKKRALDLGIRHSRGEIILTTDADCSPKSTWLRGMVAYFEPKVGLVTGYTYTEERGEKVSFPQKLRSLERIAVAAVAAGSIGLGRGLTCTGQNLAYRRQAYLEVGGFSKIGHLRSGDDDLFVQLIDRYTKWEKRYSFSKETHVRSIAPERIEQYVQQEKRRTSKVFLYSPWLITCLISTYGFYVLLLVTLGLSFFFWNQMYIAWIVFGIKTTMELSLLLRISSLLNRKDLLAFFPVAMFLHIPYLIIFGMWGTVGTYRWK